MWGWRHNCSVLVLMSLCHQEPRTHTATRDRHTCYGILVVSLGQATNFPGLRGAQLEKEELGTIHLWVPEGLGVQWPFQAWGF